MGSDDSNQVRFPPAPPDCGAGAVLHKQDFERLQMADANNNNVVRRVPGSDETPLRDNKRPKTSLDLNDVRLSKPRHSNEDLRKPQQLADLNEIVKKRATFDSNKVMRKYTQQQQSPLPDSKEKEKQPNSTPKDKSKESDEDKKLYLDRPRKKTPPANRTPATLTAYGAAPAPLPNGSNPKTQRTTVTMHVRPNSSSDTDPNAGFQICPLMLPRVKRTGNGEVLLPLEKLLKDRWLVKGLIGRGGYGEIFFAIDTKTGDEVAVKVEPRKRRGKLAKRMILEQNTLMKLQGRPHAPRIIASGQRDDRLNFIVMQLLSVNVGDLKKLSPHKRLSRSTTCRIVMQAMGALRDMHTAGYLHRDVKPANMCFGITQTTRHILMLVDFGLVRRYKNPDGTVRPHRNHAGFRGTLRYVSIRVHDRMEQIPADDLISVVYSGLELMATCGLPWRELDKSAEIRRAKQDLHVYDCIQQIDDIGTDYQDFVRQVTMLGAEDEPDYKKLQDRLKPMLEGHRMSDPYDWEEDYKEVVADHERRLNKHRVRRSRRPGSADTGSRPRKEK